MAAHIVMKLQIGPMVSIQVEGDNCKEIADALEGYQRLNKHVEGLCSGMAENVYPDMVEGDAHAEECV